MGVCSSCCGSSSEEAELMPSPETRRKLQQEAADKRRVENERRGVKDPGSVRRLQQKSEELKRRERDAAQQHVGGPSLKWQAN